MKNERKASLSINVITISIISLIVVVVSITLYFNLMRHNAGNLNNISEAKTCPPEYSCTQHQCMDVVGSMPRLANFKAPFGLICCEQRCVCPQEEKALEIQGKAYYCQEKDKCEEGEEVINLRVRKGVCCCHS